MLYAIRRNAVSLLIIAAFFLFCLSVIKLVHWDVKNARIFCFTSNRNQEACRQEWRAWSSLFSKSKNRPWKLDDQKPLPPVQKATSTVGTLTITKTVPKPTSTAAPLPDKAIVVGHLQHESTKWITKQLPDWQHFIYTVDNPKAKLHTLINKGHEAVPYLTFIIDHYYNLPSTIAFIHAHDVGHHVDNENHSNVDSLRSLQIPYVQEQGYVNLRCDTSMGCPVAVHLNKKGKKEGGTVGLYATEIPKLWHEFFPDVKMPFKIGVQCCAQFAVTREQILKRPVAQYQTYLKWVLTTPIDDGDSGRVMEHLWHIIFGRKPVHCPEVDSCYCNVYGWCSGEHREVHEPDFDTEDFADIGYDPNYDDELGDYVDNLENDFNDRSGKSSRNQPLVKAVSGFMDRSRARRPGGQEYAYDDDSYGDPYGDPYGMGGLGRFGRGRKGDIPDLEDPEDGDEGDG